MKKRAGPPKKPAPHPTKRPARPPRKQSPRLGLAPPLSSEDDRRDEQHAALLLGLRGQFALFPTETLRWVMKAGELDIELVDAQFLVLPDAEKPVLAEVREEKPPPESPESSLVRLLLKSRLKEVFGPGVTVERAEMPSERETQDFLRTCGFDVNLLCRVRFPGEKRKMRRMIFGIATLPPGVGHDEMEWDLSIGRGWQISVLLRTDPAKRVRGFLPTMSSPRPAWTQPIYFWPGTGLLDPEEDQYVNEHQGGTELVQALFGFKESAAAKRERRKRNLAVRAERKARDRRRRKQADRRKQLMGRRMVTERQLASLLVPVDVEKDSLSPGQGYPALRLWETPFEELLDDLPPEAIGFALFGWPGERTREEVLNACAWRLRRVEKRRRHLIGAVLKQFAQALLEPTEIARALRPLDLDG